MFVAISEHIYNNELFENQLTGGLTIGIPTMFANGHTHMQPL